LHTLLPSWHPLLYSRGCSQLIKCSWEDGHGCCLSEKKKQNLNRAEDEEVLSVLAKVSMQKNIIPFKAQLQLWVKTFTWH
jgi:hypothetical protein